MLVRNILSGTNKTVTTNFKKACHVLKWQLVTKRRISTRLSFLKANQASRKAVGESSDEDNDHYAEATLPGAVSGTEDDTPARASSE